MLIQLLKPYARQKYDMKVFRDQDSLELARALESIFEEAGWIHTRVFLTYKTDYAETGHAGVWVETAKDYVTEQSDAKSALHVGLEKSGLYNDSSVVRPIGCVEGRAEAGKNRDWDSFHAQSQSYRIWK